MWMVRVMGGSCLAQSGRARAGGGEGFHRGLGVPSPGPRAQVQGGRGPYGRTTQYGRSESKHSKEGICERGVVWQWPHMRCESLSTVRSVFMQGGGAHCVSMQLEKDSCTGEGTSMEKWSMTVVKSM